MTITKYLQSCILLQEGDYRLLIDPGAYSFIEGVFRPEDIPAPNAVLVTHDHRDHFDPAAARTLVAPHQADIIAPTPLAAALTEQGFSALGLDDREEIQRGPFAILPLDAPHEELPVPVPVNIAYLINDRILHPGDSLRVMAEQVEVLLLPAAGPWLNVNQALAFAERIKPKVVVPIHDAALKDFSIETLYTRHLGPALEKIGITFLPLTPGQPVALD